MFTVKVEFAHGSSTEYTVSIDDFGGDFIDDVLNEYGEDVIAVDVTDEAGNLIDDYFKVPMNSRTYTKHAA